MSVKSFFTHWFVKNLLILIAIAVLLVVGLKGFLQCYTNHGDQVTVPDFTGIELSEAQTIAEDSDLELFVTDSIFTRRYNKGTIIYQRPNAGKEVKEGRKINIVIRATKPKKVLLGDLIDMGLRQASDILDSKGFEIGKITYDPHDIGTDRISKVSVGGTTIQSRSNHTGKEYDEGTVLDLTVGLGGDNQTRVPDVMGLTYAKARHAIHNNLLNATRCKFDESVKNYVDSCNAVVVKQSPEASNYDIIKGSEVSLTFSVDPEKIK